MAWSAESEALCKKINRRITQDYNAELGQACFDFYKEEEFDEEGIKEDVMQCKYPDEPSALIDELADKDVGSDVLSSDQSKNRFAQALKDAINDVKPSPPDVPIIVDLKGLKFQLDKKDPKKAGKKIAEQCPGIFDEKEEDAFKYVLAYNNKNKLPILGWTVDTYLRYKINKKYNKGVTDFSTTNFGNEYAFFKHPVCQKGKARDKLQSVIASFWKRLIPEIQLGPPQNYIDDNINKYIDYYTAMTDAINIMLNEKENQIAPCQIDMWIIPKNVNPGLDDDSDDEDGGDGDDREKIDLIGNLEYRLKEDKASFSYEKFGDIEESMTGTRLSRFFSQNIVATLNNERKQRLIIYVDRRDPSQTDRMGKKYFETDYGVNDDDNKWDNSLLHQERKTTKKTWKDTIYIVRSTDKKYNELQETYRAETSFWASSKNLLPRSKSCPSEKRSEKTPFYGARSDLNGYQFCMSWHIDSKDCVKTYWFHNAWGTRFFPIDAYKLWPMYFQKVQNNTKAQTIKKDNIKKLAEMEQVTDPGFAKWYELTVGKDDKGELDLIRPEWIKV